MAEKDVKHSFTHLFIQSVKQQKLSFVSFCLSAGKNGDYEPTKEEVDELEWSLNQDMRDVKDTFEKLAKVPAMSALMEDEDFAKQLTETLLNSNLPANNIELCNGLGEDMGRENVCKVNPNSLSVTSVVVGGHVNSVVAGGHVNSVVARHSQPVSPYSVSQSTIQAGPEPSNGVLNSGGGVMGGMSMKTLQGGVPPYFVPNSQAQQVADSSGVYNNRLIAVSVNDTTVNQHPVPTERMNTLSDYHGNSGMLTPQLVQQLGHPSHPSQSAPRPQVTTVSNHMHVETISANTLMLSQLREHASMHTPSPSQSPLPSVRPSWPNINYQNGFPVGSAQYLHSNSGSSGPKFPTTAQLNLADYKQELTLSQYPALLQHSINTSALRSHLHNFDANQANFSAQNNYHSGSNAKS